MSQIPGLSSRRAALSLLDAVLRKGLPLEASLASATRAIERPEDRALAHAIASEVLRRAPDLDQLIDSATRKRLPDDAKARMVLRMALAQVLVLKTPEHAAIATGLALLEGGPRRLVHGVLGTLFRGKAALPDQATLLPEVAARWSKTWGEEMLGSAEHALSAPPPLDLTIKDPAQTQIWAERLEGESLAPGHVRIARDQQLTALPGFAEGAWWVQNIAASLPARLLGDGAGRTVLDLCAAPGGKTMQLAAQGWRVTGVEREEARIGRIRENLHRTKLSAEIICGDVLTWEPADPVDAILLDAPCSATGIFARHPDVLHRVRPTDIAALAEVQGQMLARLAGWLKPGGLLVYATCSLEPEEGEHLIQKGLPAALSLLPVEPQVLVANLTPHHHGWVRIYPQLGCDGFFIARFRKG